MIPAESLEHTVAEYEVRLAEKRVEVIEWRNAANAAGKRIVELRAERDALRALLVEAKMYIPTRRHAYPDEQELCDRIDAALKDKP